MVLPRDVFARFGGFRTDVGPNGKNTTYGEDLDLQDRILAVYLAGLSPAIQRTATTAAMTTTNQKIAMTNPTTILMASAAATISTTPARARFTTGGRERVASS